MVSQAMNLYDPGTMIEGKGIYLGVWTKNRHGRMLSRNFDVYAAPKDLKNSDGSNLLLTFNSAVNYVASLKNYYGHDGGNFANETAVMEAVRNNPAALNKWSLPPLDLLGGRDIIEPANLYRSRNIGSFRDTFVTKSGSDWAHFYWSLTEDDIDIPSLVWLVDFRDGVDSWVHKEEYRVSTRLVRMELRS